MAFFLIALSLGFFGSFHCIGMCGPIALALPVHRRSAAFKVLGLLSYNLGRISTYSLFGVSAGLIGKGFFIAGYQQALSITIGMLLLIGVLLPPAYKSGIGLNAKIFSFFYLLRQFFGRLFQKDRAASLFLIGVLNGFLPCGLVYMAMAGAVAGGDPVRGMVFMALFGSGTLPMMFVIPYAGQYINQPLRTRIRRAMPVLIGLTAVLLILRGLNLGIPYVSPKIQKNTETYICHPIKAKIHCRPQSY